MGPGDDEHESNRATLDERTGVLLGGGAYRRCRCLLGNGVYRRCRCLLLGRLLAVRARKLADVDCWRGAAPLCCQVRAALCCMARAAKFEPLSVPDNRQVGLGATVDETWATCLRKM